MNKRTLSKVGIAGLMAGLIVAGWFVVADMGRDRARAAATTQVPPIPVVTDVATPRTCRCWCVASARSRPTRQSP